MDITIPLLTVDEFTVKFESVRNKLVRHTLRYVNCNDDAEDVVSEVWALAVNRLGYFSSLTDERLFLSLLHSCRFKAGHMRTKRRREVELSDAVTVDRHSVDFCVDDVCMDLHPAQRLIVRGLSLGLSCREIAAKTNKSVNAVKVGIHRMRRSLAPDGLDTRPVWHRSIYFKPRSMADLWRGNHPGSNPQTTRRIYIEHHDNL